MARHIRVPEIEKPVTPQPSTLDERFIEAFENIAEMRADIRHMDADITTLKTDVSVLKTNVSALSVELAEFRGGVKSDMADLRGEMGVFKGEMEADMTGMEGRLQDHVNRQVWKLISVIAPLMVVSVGLTSYFVKILG